MTSTRRQGSRDARQEGIKTLFGGGTGEYHGPMADMWVVLVVVGFFGICVAFVWGCDRIIGPDDAELLDETGDDTGAELPDEVVAR